LLNPKSIATRRARAAVKSGSSERAASYSFRASGSLPSAWRPVATRYGPRIARQRRGEAPVCRCGLARLAIGRVGGSEQRIRLKEPRPVADQPFQVLDGEPRGPGPEIQLGEHKASGEEPGTEPQRLVQLALGLKEVLQISRREPLEWPIGVRGGGAGLETPLGAAG
jgi:hypothetical protein